MTIYIDELFFLNFIIDYLIITSTALLSSLNFKKIRVILASAFGALYSTVIFFPTLKILNIVVFKIVISFMIILIAFGCKSFYRITKLTVIYYIINFMYGGGMYAFYRFSNLGSKMNYSNGEYYIDMPLWLIILLAIFFYFLVKLIDNTLSQKKLSNVITTIKIIINQKPIITDALIDTGNALYDPITSTPVILLQKDKLHSVISSSELNSLTNTKSSGFYQTAKKYKARLIPYYDASGNSNSIIAIKPDSVTDITNSKVLQKTLIGIVEHRLSPDLKYSALLHSRFYD